MDWNAAIEKNREALKRVLATLAAMAGLRGQFTLFPQEGAQSQGLALAEKLSPALPRHLHRAVLRLLRPAEAAARRLIIVAARGLVAPPPRPRKPRPKPIAAGPLLRSLGIAIVMSPADLARAAAARRAAAIRAARPRSLSLPLFDRLPHPFGACRRSVPAHAAPRILFPGVAQPFALPSPPSPGDPIDAAHLGRRLAALAAVLDDLPGQARRFARWRSRIAAGVQNEKSRIAAGAPDREIGNAGRVRLWPLKPGRPPGWRRRPTHDVHEVLNVVHGLACWTLGSPGTS